MQRFILPVCLLLLGAGASLYNAVNAPDLSELLGFYSLRGKAFIVSSAIGSTGLILLLLQLAFGRRKKRAPKAARKAKAKSEAAFGNRTLPHADAGPAPEAALFDEETDAPEPALAAPASDTLEDRAAFIRQCLKRKDARQPARRADLQEALGDTLRAIGQTGTGTQILSEALAAYLAASQVLAKSDDSDRLADLQTKLGHVHFLIGQRDKSTADLEAAIDALRTAIMLRSPETSPEYHTATQQWLGSALLALGQNQNRLDLVEQAAVAFASSIEPQAKDKDGGFGIAEHQLGYALRLLSQKQDAAERLQNAADVFRHAGKARDKEYDPVDSALSQENLALMLEALAGEEGHEPEILLEAVKTIREAIRLYDEGGKERLAERARTHEQRIVSRLESLPVN